jgi:hypothetical protein
MQAIQEVFNISLILHIIMYLSVICIFMYFFLLLFVKTKVVFVNANFQKENVVSRNRISDYVFGNIFNISYCFHRSKQNLYLSFTPH